jgi:hypothetical protein
VAVAAGSPIGEECGTQAELGELVARPEVAVHGELHAEDEAAGVVGHTIELAGGFTCGHRHDVMAKLRCSWMTTTMVAGTVGNGRCGSVQSGARVRAERGRVREEEQVNLASML